MMKKLFIVFVFLSLMTLLFAACDKTANTGGSGGSSNGGNATVHLSDQTFAQSTITISKGSSIALVDDVATPHIIANGSWMNGSAQSMQENGMPEVNNMQISGSGSSQIIGPFMTSGTFHLYCTVHPGMNLTVIVQ